MVDVPLPGAPAESTDEAGASHHNPRARVEAVFGRIARTRMADVPLCNPALAVEAVGFRRWQDEWLGILITPWAINLMLLPGGGGGFRPVWPGDSQWWAFPSGDYEFLGNREAGLGPYQICSLFSPVLEFASQEAARDTAHAALVALFAPAHQGAPGNGAAAERGPVSRRAFLRGLVGSREG